MKKVSKILALALSASLTAAALSACGGAGNSSGAASAAGSATGSKELNLYTWDQTVSPDVLKAFEKESGIKVNFSSFDTDETMLSKLETAKGGDYDLIIADDYIIQTAIEEKLVAKLDKSKLANIGNVDPVYQKQFYDPSDEYTVPFVAGVQTIVYNPEAVGKEITGYADLWDPAFKDSLGVIGNFRVINGMALKVLGESYNTEDVAKIDKAGEKLKSLAPNIRLILDTNLQDSLISGEINAAIMYTSQVTQSLMANDKLKAVFPKEGIGFGIMAGFVPSKAPHADAAHKLLDYLLEPENAAKCAEYNGYYITNKAGVDKLDPKYKSYLSLPADVDLKNMEMIKPVGAKASAEHEKVWTAFKAAAGQ